jgi:RNA polymerase sigma-70 factor (ECF subfamily)
MIEENKYMRTLIDSAQQGKLVALEELYEINIGQVHTLISRLAGNKLIAEQLTKNILVRAWERITEDGPGQNLFSDWIRELSVHITVDELREPTLITDKKFKKQLKKEKHNADYSSDQAEKIIAKLDLEHRIIFVLNKIENYSLYQVSNFMGINESELETKFSESIEQISKALSETGNEQNLNINLLNLQKVIEPDTNILKKALEEIKEVRAAKIKEEDEEIEAEKKEEIEQIEKALKKDKKEKTKDKKSSRELKIYRPAFNMSKKIVLIVALPLIAFLGFHLIFSSPEWSVSIESGTPLINNKPISSVGELSSGDIIRTDNLSSATIGITKVGKININGSTTFKRLKDSFSGQLVEGGVNIIEYGNEEALSVEVPEATIKNLDQKANYSVQVDKRGNSIVRLEAGRLRVLSDKYIIVFPKHYSIRILKGGGVGAPYYSDSESDISHLLEEYLFNGKKGITLNKIIKLSTRKEAITLWNLLHRVKPKHKGAVYDKLYELVPHPDSITKNDILNLDQDPLRIWLEEIEWTL